MGHASLFPARRSRHRWRPNHSRRCPGKGTLLGSFWSATPKAGGARATRLWLFANSVHRIRFDTDENCPETDSLIPSLGIPSAKKLE